MNTNDLTANLDTRMNFGPSFSREAAMQFEKSLSGWDVSRVACLMTCTRSADQLRHMDAQFPEAFMAMYSTIQEYKDHVRSLLDIAEAASRRMELAGGYVMD